MQRILALCAAAAVLTSCAEYKSENPALTAYPSIQAQIQSFYDQNATEDDWVCNEVQLDTIDKSKVARQTATQVVIAVTYYFTSFDESPQRGGNQCQGFNTRFFTFDKGAGSQLSLASMTGPQRGVSG